MKRSFKEVRNVFFYSILCLCMTSMFNSAYASIQDDLWQKAVKIAEKNSTWIPGQIVQHQQVFNTKGKLEEDTKIDIQLEHGQEGKIAMKILKATSNGKDVTKEARKDAEEEMAIEDVIDNDSPFSASKQDEVSVVRLDQQEIIQEKTCVAYQYTYTTETSVVESEKEVTIKGIAWIEESTGVPYEVHSEIISVPLKEDKMKITELKQIDRFVYTEHGEWYAVENVINMKVEVKSFLMKFKGTINTVSQYSQHWSL